MRSGVVDYSPDTSVCALVLLLGRLGCLSVFILVRSMVRSGGCIAEEVRAAMASEVQSPPVENGSSETDRDIWSRPPEQLYHWAVDFYKLGELGRGMCCRVWWWRWWRCVCVL